MDVALQLWGELPGLAVSEAVHVARIEGPAHVDRIHVRSAVLTTDAAPAFLAERLALSWGVGWLVAAAAPDVDAVGEAAAALDPAGHTFAVRAKRLDRDLPADLNGAVTRRIAKTVTAAGHTVDLEAPGYPIRVLLDREALVAAPWHEIDQVAFESRHVKHRAFFYPVTLHPRLARVLVNLAEVRRGATLWDPFCGTGGILLEAALVGAQAVASDLYPKMVEGTKATLAEVGAAPAWSAATDVAEAARRLVADGPPVDVIVTDPPYGKGATTNREDRDALYRRFFDAAADVLRPGAALVAMFPHPDIEPLAGTAFTLDEQHAWRVHGSMTRHLCRFTRR